MAPAAEEEFAKLKEKEQFVCDRTKLRREWQMRKLEEWRGKQEINKDTPVYCFAICPYPWPLENEDDDDDDDDDQESEKEEGFKIKIFILVPEDCSIYHFANFRAPSNEIACVAADSKIYLFGGGCGTRVWYMDVDVDVVRKGNSIRGKKWKEAKECLNSEKCHPLSFSLGSKIYALETLYLPPSSNGITEKLDGEEVNGCWFEVLDTSTDGSSSWEPLCNPPYPFGACTVVGSWASDGSGDQGGCYRIFIEASFSYNKYLFVYDIGGGTWDKFNQYCGEALVEYPWECTGYRPSYSWAVHLAGKDFAPFPPHVPYPGDLRVLTGLKRSIPDLKQAASECKKGLELPVPVKVDTDKKEAVIVPSQNLSRSLTGWDLESLWTLHCLPVEKMGFWQAIHLGGSSFCTLAFYHYTNCCSKHRPLYVRVSRFNITDAAADGVSGPIFAARYGTNKVYLAAKSNSSAKVGVALYAFIQIPINIMTSFLIDKTGRKPLILFATSGVTFACLLTGTCFFLKDHQILVEWVPSLVVFGVVFFISSFSSGYGAIPWVIMSEMFPLHVKGVAGSLVNLVHWVLAWLLTYTFNFLFVWSPAGTFFVYAAFNVGAIIFIIMLMPETKGKTLEEIQASLNQL